MTTLTQLKKFTRGGSLTVMAVSAMLLVGTATGANSYHNGNPHTFGGVVTGGAIGGIIGGAVAGKKGVIPGVVGGAIVGGALSSRPPPPPPQRTNYPTAPAYDNGLVYNIQSSLTRLGYDPGPIDGVYGQRTADAISAYEYNNQLPVTGQPSPGVNNHIMTQLGG